MCATGIAKGTLAATAANISYRSPRQTIRSVDNDSQTPANCSIVFAMDSEIVLGELPFSTKGNATSIENPSLFIASTVLPNAGATCVPNATSCNVIAV